MIFEFDDNKSQSNCQKHGIDFIEAQALWNDDEKIEVPAKTIDEERYVLIGKIDSVVWAAIITYREERIRIISVRRARKIEVALYES